MIRCDRQNPCCRGVREVLQHQGLDSQPGDFLSRLSSHVAFLRPPGERTLSSDRKLSGGCHHRVSEKAGADNQLVIASERITRGRDLPQQELRYEKATSPTHL